VECRTESGVVLGLRVSGVAVVLIGVVAAGLGAAASYSSHISSDLRRIAAPAYAVPGKLAPGFSLVLEASL
jgi:hypothetical protein